MPEIALDCCVISNFALAGELRLLEALYHDKAHITDFVAAEIMRGIQAGHALLEAIPRAVRAGWLKETGLRTAGEKRLFGSLSRSLGLGEASTIAVAESRRYLFASDDRVARTEAAALGVPLTGTLGILIRTVRTGVCDLQAADRCHARMVKEGFFSPVRSMREILSG